MENWIFPLTVLPGVGLLIISTTNWAIALAAEVEVLLKEEVCRVALLRQKIRQLQRLHLALIGLYLCAALFVLGGFVAAVQSSSGDLPMGLMAGGLFFLAVATGMLIDYATRAVRIKRQQFLERIHS